MKTDFRLILTSYNKFALKRILLFFKFYFKKLKNKYIIAVLPKKISKLILLRSPHVNKKSWEQFEKRWFKKLLVFDIIFYNQINFFENLPNNAKYQISKIELGVNNSKNI